MTILDRVKVILEGDTVALTRSLSGAAAAMEQAGRRMSAVGKEMTTKVTLPLVGLGALAVHSFGQQEDAMARVNAILKTTGGSAGVTAAHIEQLGQTLQKTTRFADEETMAAAGLLLVFKNVKNVAGANNDVFDRTLKVSQDLAELMGRDLQGAVMGLGKAFENLDEGLMMLKRANITLTDSEKAHVKLLMDTNRELEAQKFILTVVEGKIGGVAAAMAKTPLGQFKQAWNELDDALENIGAILTPVILTLAKTAREVVKAFQDLSPAGKNIVVIMAAVVASIGPVLFGFGTLIKHITTIIPVVMKLGTLMAPAGLLLVGLGLLVGYLVKLKLAAMEANEAMRASSATFEQGLMGKNPANATKTADRLDVTIKKLKGSLIDLKVRGFDAAEKGWKGMAEALRLEIVESEANIKALERQRDMLRGVAAAAAVVAGPKDPPAWIGAAAAISETLKQSLDAAAHSTLLLGSGFDLPKARSEAYKTAIEALIAAHVDFDAKVGPNGETLRELAAAYGVVAKEVTDAEKKQDLMNDTLRMAQSLMDGVLTPTETYSKKVGELTFALSMGAMSQEDFNLALRGASKELTDGQHKIEDWGKAMKRAAADALESFLAFATGAGGSFKDFVDDVLREMQRLAAKIIVSQIFKALKIDVTGFAGGGFLGAGEVGVVGEAGPELVTGGRGGMSITPFNSANMAGAAAGGGGGAMSVSVSISAIDAKSFVELAEANPGAITGPLLKALSRSQALRGALLR